MAPVRRRGCCKQGHLWHREPEEEENAQNQLDDGRTSTVLVLHVILKFFATVMAFCLVLCGCVVAKGTLLLMVANILPLNNESNATGYQLDVKDVRAAAAGWSWAVLLVFAIPEIFNFISAFHRVRSHCPAIPNPEGKYVGMVVLMEILHVCGLGILLFLILPRLDSLVASTITTAVVFIPSLLKIICRNSTPSISTTGNLFERLKARLEQIRPWSFLDLLAVVIQIAGFVYLPFTLLPYTLKDQPGSAINNSSIVFYTVSLACIMTSCVWWEIFLSDSSDNLDSSFLNRLQKCVRKNQPRRCKIQLGLAPMKLILMGLLMVLFYWLNCLTQSNQQTFKKSMADLGHGFLFFFRIPKTSAETAEMTTHPTALHLSISSYGVQTHDYWIALIVQFSSALIAVKVAVFACQTLMQYFAFSLPLMLSSPVLVMVVGIFTHVKDHQGSALQSVFPIVPAYPSFNAVEQFDSWTDIFQRSFFWIWILWFASQTWITRHIWRDTNTVRLAKPNTLFHLPIYSGILVDQDLAHRRRSGRRNSQISDSDGANNFSHCKHWRENEAVKVYACVTMWHESKNEMRKLIGSLVGLDAKQNKPGKHNPGPTGSKQGAVSDGYNLECHVFFDDAFEQDISVGVADQRLENHVDLLRNNASSARCICPPLPGDNSNSEVPASDVPSDTSVTETSTLIKLIQSTVDIMGVPPIEVPKQPTCPVHGNNRTKLELVNTYVKQFWSLLLRTTDHKSYDRYAVTPQEVTVPYGACYIWKFKNGTQLFLHLKDTRKVKHRKRWSQVMYLHYIENMLMPNLVLENVQSGKMENSCENHALQQRAANTFVLALDGDMDFKPSSVQLLLDFMKKDSNLGAVCGRIHPTGGGPVVWYQQFEYATSQWLQKTTEHIIGSVLCSPGCFSLYRADALLHHKVIGKYSRKPEEAMECLKYDQGEDRYLCTLMLKAGYRIRYCALAFAKTNAPVSFDELFNQRRRWISSSTANLIDILQNARKLIKRNEHISYLYILYQILQLISTALTPGMTVLMLIESSSIAFCISNIGSLALAIGPILVFTAICLKAPEKFQLLVAQVLSIAYAILMVAELISIALQFTKAETFMSPTAFVVLTILGIFLATALLHPRSFPCYLHGLLYFFWIPSMYVLLPIYALCNLDNLAWGTREDNTTSKAFLQGEAAGQQSTGWHCSFGPALQCVCCNPRPNQQEAQSISYNTLPQGDMYGKTRPSCPNPIANEAQKTNSRNSGAVARSSSAPPSGTGTATALSPSLLKRLPIQHSLSLTRPTLSSQLQEEEFNKVDESLSKAHLYHNPIQLENVWTDLLHGRLRPDRSDMPSRSAIRLRTKLHELRDRSVLIFFAVNGLVVAFIYLLQNNKELYVTFPWPWGGEDTLDTELLPSDNMRSTGKNLWESESSPDSGTSVILDKDSCVSHRSFLKYDEDTKSIQVEPIGVLFILVYVSILIIQFLCMLIHRIITFSHLIASTGYNVCRDHVKRRRSFRNSTLRRERRVHLDDSYGKYKCDCQFESCKDKVTIQDETSRTGKDLRVRIVAGNQPTTETAPILGQECLDQPWTFRSSTSLPTGSPNLSYSPLRPFMSAKYPEETDFAFDFSSRDNTEPASPMVVRRMSQEISTEEPLVDSEVSEVAASDSDLQSHSARKKKLSRQDHFLKAIESSLSSRLSSRAHK